MSTLRVDTLQTTDTSVSVQVADLALISNKSTSFDTVAQMVNSSLTSIDYIKLNGYTVKGDSDQGFLYVDRTDTTTPPNNGTVFVTVGGLRIKRLGLTAVTPQMFGAKADGVADDTTAFANAWAYCSTTKLPFLLNSKYAIASWNMTGAHVNTIISDGAELIGNATVPTPALWQMFDSSDIKHVGQLKLTGNYNTNYDVGFWCHGAASAQYIEINNVTVTGFKWMQRWGNALYPDALISENCWNGGHSYGCPALVDVIGGQAFIHINQATLVSDFGGGSGAWLTLPRRGIQATGGNVRVTGGELLMTDVTTGRLVNIRPIESVIHPDAFGAVTLVNVTVENASSLCTLSNENGVATPASGLGGFTAIGCSGFVGSDSDVMVYGTSAFSGRVTIKNCDFYYSAGSRTQNNMQFDNASADIFTDKNSFGKGFKNYLGGIVGGIVHFDNEQIIEVTGLTGLVFPAATQTLLPFQSFSAYSTSARWQTSYNSVNGIMTIPAGGLNNIEVSVNLAVPGVTAGEMRLFVNGTQWVSTPFINGSGQLTTKISSLPAGTTLQVGMFATTGTGTASSATPLQRFSVTASR